MGFGASSKMITGILFKKQEAEINPPLDAMSLEDAYSSVKPSSKPEDFKQITAIAKQAKAEQTAHEMNDAWTS